MAFNFDEFLAQEGDAPTNQNSGFDFDKFLHEETGKATWGTVAQRTIADSLKAVSKPVADMVNPLGIGVDQSMRPSVNPIGASTMLDPNFQRKAAPWMPTAGTYIGSAFGPWGAPLGAGLGSIGESIVKIGLGDKTVPTTPLAASVEPMTQAFLTGLPDVNGWVKAAPGAASIGDRVTGYVAGKVGAAARGVGQRALGFTKTLLKDKAGRPIGQTAARADAAAGTALETGVIRPFSSATGMEERAKAVADTARANIKNTVTTLDKTGADSINTNDVVNAIYSQLDPKKRGGAYDVDKKIIDEIAGTVQAHGNGPIGFASANDLKQKLFDEAKFHQGGDSKRAELYRRASGIVRDALDKAVARMGVSELGPELVPQTTELISEYGRNKKTLGAMKDAARALADKSAAERGNRWITPTDIIVGSAAGAGELASGDTDTKNILTKVGAVMLAKRGLERFGPSTTASTLYGLSKLLAHTSAVNIARRALISRLITREGSVETGGSQ